MSSFNPFDAEDRMRAQYSVAITVVANRFCWLDPQLIENPPHTFFDAYLARQIAIHIACEFFGVPRRRLAEMTNRARARLAEAIAAIENRRSDAVFEHAYLAMCDDAHSMFSELMEAKVDG